MSAINSTGPVLFARYAYAPNALGYCGPDDHATVFDLAVAGGGGGELARLVPAFEGAWPYLELIAHANAIADPLDARVVEAYWVGNALLDRVTPALLGASLDDRFRRRLGVKWSGVAEAVLAGARPHHSFHVFCVYPWLGLLRSGLVDEPLRVLDRCRIRWGKVEEVAGDIVAVTCRLLTWDGHRLALGQPTREWARAASSGAALVESLAPGDTVALHWDWVCDRLANRQLAGLRSVTTAQLAVANGLTGRGPVSVLT